MRAIETKPANARDDIKAFDEDLAIENGAPRNMSWEIGIWNIAINGKNVEGNEITEQQRGLVCSRIHETSKVRYTSEPMQVFSGDEQEGMSLRGPHRSDYLPVLLC